MNTLIDCYKDLGLKSPKKNIYNVQKNFRGAIVGKSGIGKTNLLVNMIFALRSDFNHLLLVVKTPDEPLYKHLKVTYSPKITISEKTPEIKDIPKKTLLVLDDQIVESGKKSNFYKNLETYIYGRKHDISVIILSQTFKDIPIIIRKQLNFIIFKLPSSTDIRIIKSHLDLDKEEMKQIIKNSEENWIFVNLDCPKNSKDRIRLFV